MPYPLKEIMSIEIENGCFLQNDGSWQYTYTTVGEDTINQVVFKSVTFQSAPGEVPVIGDFIEGGMLVKRTEPKVNADWSRWRDRDLWGNP